MFKTTVKVPVANIVVGRVKDLREPDKKMSKSSPAGCLFLDDEPNEVRKKLRKATATDLGLENLKYLYQEFVGPDVPASNEILKEDLAEKINEKFANLRGVSRV